MRLLLIAYEFPPSVAAQSLRWQALTRELGKMGVMIDVVCPHFKHLPQADSIQDITIHRCYPGPIRSAINWIARIKKDRSSSPSVHRPFSKSRLMKAYDVVRKALDALLLGDSRIEWFPFAYLRARKLLLTKQYDAVICSHEPWVSLLVGLGLKQSIPTLIFDMGDPLDASYHHRVWQPLYRHIQKYCLLHCDGVVTTTDTLSQRFKRIYPRLKNRSASIAQGFQVNPYIQSHEQTESTKQLTLVYTGTFYRGFRDPKHLIKAIEKLPNISLIVVGENSQFLDDFQEIKERVQLIPKLDHNSCLKLQAHADVLVNLANELPEQVPGKVYEYLGAARPILHICANINDPITQLIQSTNRGVCVENDVDSITKALGKMYSQRSHFSNSYNLGLANVTQHSWNNRANQYRQFIRQIKKQDDA